MIVVGHVYTSEYEDREGDRRSSLEMRATSVGQDVARTIVRIEKPACDEAHDSAAGESDESVGGSNRRRPTRRLSGKALPLTGVEPFGHA